MKKLLVHNPQLLVISIVTLLFFLYPTCIAGVCFPYTLYPTHAQESFGPSFTYQIQDQQAQDGDILNLKEGSINRSSESYDLNLFGVLVTNPLVVYKGFDETEKAIAKSGVVQVNVTNLNGEIKKGDFITSSSIPGKGQRASQSGRVVGVALEDFNAASATNSTFENRQVLTNKIPVSINIEYAQIGNPLLTFLSNQSIERSIRNLGAVIIVIICLIIGFRVYSKSIPEAIEAIGRNPLAKSSIQRTTLLSLGLTVIAIFIGLLAALILLRI